MELRQTGGMNREEKTTQLAQFREQMYQDFDKRADTKNIPQNIQYGVNKVSFNF